ncbi:Delta(24(24(1)))-sterol reductase like protein, partial [Hortaea werneckii]
MTVTRSQTGKTPRKSGVPDGFVETPGTKRRSGKAGSSERSPSPLDDKTTNGHSTARDNEAKGAKKSTVNGAGKDMNGAPKGRVIDGWLEGSDPKIDVNPHFDFGGTPGVTAMMIGFPLLMWYMWIGATYYDGKFPSEPNMTWSEFGKHLFNLAYNGSFPHLKAWAIYWIFFLTQGIFYLTLPGVYSMGKPLPHEGGKQLRYYNNAVYSFYLTNAIAAVLHFTGLFKLYTLIDEFGPLMSVAIISGFLVAIVAYVSA